MHMLCQFIVKNFKSYRDETVFDLQAANIDEHAESLLHHGDDDKTFLPVSVIYGPNGGGKSGILEAFNCLIQRITWPLILMKLEGENQRSFMERSDFSKCVPFLFNETSPNEPTEFTIFFRVDGLEFRYALSLFKNDVVAESLHSKKIGVKRSAMIFERDKNGVTLGASMRKDHINTNVSPNMPYLSFLSISYNIAKIYSINQWFMMCSLYYTAQGIPSILIEPPKVTPNDIFDKKRFLEIVAEIDIPIDGYAIKHGDDKDSAHDIYVIRKKDGKTFNLNLREESQGTRKLFNLLPIALVALKAGGVLIIDEMDASLHPKLLRYIIKLFKNKKVNTNNAQLIFTSHDVTTMKGDLFRRDEIWFAAKNDEGASEIYTLYEIRDTDGTRVRANAPFDKQYMQGRYGADPYLSNMLSDEWMENRES